MKKLLILLALMIPGVHAAETGGYPNATTPLSGTERLLGDQNMVTVNITPAQIASYIASGGYIYSMLPALVANDCLSNNGTILLWATCGGGGGGTGTVTSVGLSMPGGFTVANSPITTNGIIAVSTTLSGPIKGTGSGFSAALASDIVGLFSGCTGTEYLGADGNCHSATGSGTVTSVALTAPSYFTVTGSPITSSGTIALSGTSEPQNEFLGTPSGTSGALGVRAIVAADLPSSVAYLSGPPTQYQTAVFSNATTITGVGPGTSGQCYMSNGATANGSFQACATAFGAWPSLISGDCLSNNGTTISWVNCTGTSVVFQTNGVNNTSQTTLNLQNGGGITFSNPSGGNVTVSTTQALSTEPLAPPVQSAASTSTTGGTLAAATYYYVVEATSTSGNSSISNEENVTTTGTTSSNVITWAAVTGATGYNIYRGTATGAENVYYTVGAVTTYTDTNATSTSGSPPGAAYTVQATDATKVLVFSNPTPVGVTMPQATGSSFGAGFALTMQNKGAGLVTVTPTTSTINGAASLAIGQNMGCSPVSDGTNYQVAACTALLIPVVAAGSGTSFTPVCNAGMATTVNTYTATGNLTINLPTGCADGQGVKLRIKFTASVTYTWNAGFHAGTTNGITSLPTASSSASGEDYMQFDDDTANSRFNYLAIASF